MQNNENKGSSARFASVRSSFCQSTILCRWSLLPAAKKKMPDIPVQRALVKYHGGTEALIVESTLDGEGGDYG